MDYTTHLLRQYERLSRRFFRCFPNRSRSGLHSHHVAALARESKTSDGKFSNNAVRESYSHGMVDDVLQSQQRHKPLPLVACITVKSAVL